MNYVMFVGLNDKDQKVQVVDKESAQNIIADTVGACTMYDAKGVFTHEDGVQVRENTLAVEVFETDKEQVEKYCKTLKRILNQESIAVRPLPSEVYFF